MSSYTVEKDLTQPYKAYKTKSCILEIGVRLVDGLTKCRGLLFFIWECREQTRLSK